MTITHDGAAGFICCETRIPWPAERGTDQRCPECGTLWTAEPSGGAHIKAIGHSRVPASLVEAEDDAEMAGEMHDLSCHNLRAAQQAITEAHRNYVAASEQWNQTSAELTAAQNALTAERKAAGLVLTADGYRPVTP